MNFFEHQARARKQTSRLLVLFVLALVVLVFITAFSLSPFFAFLGTYLPKDGVIYIGRPLEGWAATLFDWRYVGSIACVVFSVITLAALFRMYQLRSGGHVIAEQMGGRLLNTNPRNAKEKQLLNIVEEMAIASGLSVPSVYLIEEPSINAFAAGFQPTDAVIGVTQGCVEHLDRHELQGVVAHEFSHILNGDMCLNLRLVGMVYGVMVIALLGQYLLNGATISGSSSSRLTNSNKRSSLGIGLVLVVLGYLGAFLGNIIKAGISRQREFLADASAVQFTRNNEGITGALKKIGRSPKYSLWLNHDANEISHMLFSQGLQFKLFSRWMATHPPLNTRIKRINPRWDGVLAVDSANPTNVIPRSKSPLIQQDMMVSSFAVEGVSEAISKAGELTDQQINFAVNELSALKSEFDVLCEQVHNPYMARAFVYGVLLSPQAVMRDKQWQDIKQHQSADLLKQIHWVFEQLQYMKPMQSMHLLDMALPILKVLTESQYEQFKRQMLRLITMDKIIELREWALFYLVDYYCRPKPINPLHSASLKDRKPIVARLLSALANAGAESEKEAQVAFLTAVERSLGFSLRWYSANELTIKALTEALKQARYLKPLEKPLLLKACVAIAEVDNCLTPNELVIITCIAQALDCPLPPALLKEASS